MSVTTYTSLRNSVHVQVVFTEPIMNWTDIASRFFAMIYSALRSKLTLNLSDFSFNYGNALSDVRARYNLYGGATSVSLLPDRLAFDFPNLLPTDYSIAADVMATIHDAFPKAFEERLYDRIEVQTYEHVELGSAESVIAILDRFKMPGLESYFDLPIVQQPSCKLNLSAQDMSWQCSLQAERSLLVSSALFLAITVSLRNVTPSMPFLEKQMLIRGLMRALTTSLGLEPANAN